MSPRYQVGGALRPGAIYVTRAADAEACAALLAGDAIHVLGPRQLGKSSLRLHLAARLEAAGLRVAHLDLSGFGAPRSTEDWITAITEELALELGDSALETLTRPSPGVSSARYLARLIASASAAGPWVLFLDEVDALVNHPEAADALLGALRAAWDEIVDAAGQRPFRLCLSGVAAPFELGADPNRTPFNISRPILLQDFTAAEATPLSAGFPAEDRAELLAEVLRWTEGHPYMSHRLAERLAAGEGEGPPAERVASLVHRLFVAGGTHGDANLAGAARRLSAGAEDLPEMLALYRKALVSGGVEADGRRAATMRLLLSGLVAWRSSPAGPRLRVRNPIYAAVFDRAWVEDQLDRRPFAAAYEQWMRAGQTEDGLLRGVVLASAQAWATGRADLSQEEMAFLLRSAEAWRAEEGRRAELEQARLHAALADEQRERARLRSRALAMAAFIAVVVAIGLGALAWQLVRANGVAERATAEATAQAERVRGWAAWQLVDQANGALALPDLALAEVSAATALGLRESPAARGVLLQVSGEARPSLRWQRQLRASMVHYAPRVGRDHVLVNDDKDLLVLDAADGHVRSRIDGAAIFGRAVGADGTGLYHAVGDGDRPTWTAAGREPEPLPALTRFLNGYYAMDLAPDHRGARLFVLSLEYRLAVFSLPDHALVWERPLWGERTCQAGFSPDDTLLSVGCSDGSLEVMRAADGVVVARNTTDSVGGFARGWLAQDRLYLGGWGAATDGVLRLWDGLHFRSAASARRARAWGLRRESALDGLGVNTVSSATPGLGWLGLKDGTILGLDSGLGSAITRFRAGPASAHASAGDGHLYTLTSDDVLRSWDTSGIGARAAQPPKDTDRLAAFARGPSGLLLSTEDALIEIRDPRSGETLRSLRAPEPFRRLVETVAGIDIFTHTGALMRHTAAGWTPLRAPEGGGSQGLIATAEGQTVAAVRQTPPSIAWRAGAVRALPCSTTSEAAALRPDGRWLALGCTERISNAGEPVVIFDLDTGAVAHELPPLAPRVSRLAWRPDGSQLLIARGDGRIWTWSVGGGVALWPGRLEAVVADLEISPSGRWVAGLDTGGRLRVWDADGALRAEVGPLVPEPVRLLLDDQHLTLREADGGVAVWSLEVLDQPAEALIETARARWGLEIRDGEPRSTAAGGL